MDAWLVRWDVAREPRPRLVHGGDARSFGDDATGFVAFQGYLFDREALGPVVAASDAARIAAARERWQDGLFDKLRGAFALAIWDESRRHLVVGRDAMGLVPCFYWWHQRRLLVSPSIDAILAQPEVAVRFNRVLIAEYLQNVRAYQRIDETFYEDICRLPPAHTLSVHGSGLLLTRYWDPIPPGFAWASEDELSRFTSVLGTAVDRCIGAGADSVALSGGFDSVSIAVMAAERRRARPPLHAVSLRFAGTSSDEGDVQTQVARALGMPQLIRSLDDCLDDDPFLGGLLPICRVSPNPPMSAWQPMYARLFGSAVGRGLQGLMMGTGGDELFYVNMGYARDCLAALDARGLWRFCRTLQRNWGEPLGSVARYVVWDSTVKSELRRATRRLLDVSSPALRDRVLRRRLRRALPSWLARGNKELMERLEHRPTEVARVETGSGESSYVRAMRRLPQSPTFALELEQLHAWTARLGVRFFFPYFDRDLVELSLRMAPADLIAGGEAKAPLRRLVAQRLPGVAMPPRKVFFDRAFHTLFRLHGQRAWRSLGGARLLAGLDIIAPQQVDAMMDDYFREAGARSISPWLVLSMELWLRGRSGAA